MKLRPTARPLILAILAGIGSSLPFFPTSGRAQFVPVYTVNTTSDTVVAGACASGAAGCSLRGAIQAANGVSDSVINFSIPEFCASTGCVINLTHELATISSKTTIDGPGPSNLTVRRDDRSVDSKLANISTRGLVQTGDDVLIAGTIILGSQPQKVIVRAIGPSLPFPGVLENPTLELRNQNGAVLDANDNWVDSANKQAIMDSGIPPSRDLESAIVASLPSNGASYTAIVRGVNDTTGIAVVEAYGLD